MCPHTANMARREDDDDENDGEPRAVSLVEEIFDERTHALQHNIHIPLCNYYYYI